MNGKEPLPASARQRLGTRVFTSDLSVDEWVCLQEAGGTPLGLVMGSSIYHVGLQIGAYTQNQELTVLSEAMHRARSLAMERMQAEAEALAADGVVGVAFQAKRYEWGPDLIEFIAMGTAVRGPEGAAWKAAGAKPFASDLSGQDFWKVLRTGHRPVGLVMGNCVYHVAHQSLRQTLAKIGRNAEMENFTQATYDARELAMARLAADAEEAGASGVVGTRIQESPWMWGGHVIEFFAVGTAVVRDGEQRIPAPQVVLGLNG